jgi:hypothetical protein
MVIFFCPTIVPPFLAFPVFLAILKMDYCNRFRRRNQFELDGLQHFLILLKTHRKNFPAF